MIKKWKIIMIITKHRMYCAEITYNRQFPWWQDPSGRHRCDISQTFVTSSRHYKRWNDVISMSARVMLSLGVVSSYRITLTYCSTAGSRNLGHQVKKSPIIIITTGPQGEWNQIVLHRQINSHDRYKLYASLMNRVKISPIQGNPRWHFINEVGLNPVFN